MLGTRGREKDSVRKGYVNWASVKYLKRRWLQGYREVEISRKLYKILSEEGFKRGVTILQFIETLIKGGHLSFFPIISTKCSLKVVSIVHGIFP